MYKILVNKSICLIWCLMLKHGQLFAGSKILLTSRNEGVGLHPDFKYIIFRPRFLTHEESWEVFQKIALFERNDLGMSYTGNHG